MQDQIPNVKNKKYRRRVIIKAIATTNNQMNGKIKQIQFEIPE